MRIKLFLILSVITTLTACGQGSDTTSQEASSQSASSVSMFGAKWDYYQQWLPNAPLEDIDDPQQWDDFRIEFIWRPTKERDIKTHYVFSMKMDGTDVRKAVDRSLLLVEDGAYMQERLRSPNNRYLAAHMVASGENAGSFVVLVDIKNQTSKKIDKHLNRMRFTWSPDSSLLYFFGSKGLTVYNIETEELTKAPFKVGNPSYMTLAKNGLFLGGFQDFFKIVDPKTEKHTYLYPNNASKRYGAYAFSPDGTKVAIIRSKTCIFDITTTDTRKINCLESSTPQNFDITNTAVITSKTKVGTVEVPFDGSDLRIIVPNLHFSTKESRIINRQIDTNIPNYPNRP